MGARLRAALPVRSAPTARPAIGVSRQPTLAGLKAPADAKVLTQVSEGPYDRRCAAPGLLDLLARHEERVASRGARPA